MFDFELEKAIKTVGERRAKRVLLQFPEGLKPFSTEVVDRLRSRLPEVEFLISGEPSFGACDVAEDEVKAVGADLILHFGHSPYTWYYPKFPTLFVEVRSTSPLREDLVSELIDVLVDYGARSVSLTSTLQYVRQMGELASKLEDRFKVKVGRPSSPYMHEGQVLGCDYRAVEEADVNVHLSSGLFHALGVGLATGRPVVKVDLDNSRVVDLTPEVNRVLKVRYGKILQAMDARTWVIVQGLKVGQNRPLMVRFLESSLRSKGFKTYVVTSKNLSVESLRNIDRSYVDAYVITSCPRLPTDDLYNFEKPVLTPGEAKMVINNRLEPYIFPW
jgi:arCOG04112 universal archaeal diphthamide biosynthesis domain protein